MNSTAMSAKGRVRVSKHSAEELARLGRSDDGVDSGSEASGCSSGEEDDEVPARQRARRQSRPIMPRVSVRSDPLANVGSVRLSGDEARRRLQQGGSSATFSTKLVLTRPSSAVYDLAPHGSGVVVTGACRSS